MNRIAFGLLRNALHYTSLLIFGAKHAREQIDFLKHLLLILVCVSYSAIIGSTNNWQVLAKVFGAKTLTQHIIT